MALIFTSIVILLSLLLYLSKSVGSAETANLLSAEELNQLIDNMRGDDSRLVRWDATRYTRSRQRDGGCDALPKALELIGTPSAAADDARGGLACSYATFCVTDNPAERDNLSHVDGIHEAIVNLVQSPNSHASAMASHLIYIATFANEKNHQGFFEAGAVASLATIVKDKDSTNLQLMWAASALQNLAASYCDTDHDGRCYWEWNRALGKLSIRPRKTKVISEGDMIRQAMLEDTELVDVLKQYACRGPVQGRMTMTNPYIGENAEIGEHEESNNIVPWAAAGALKNLALEPKARPLIEDSLKCLCRMAHSKDWLERNKGEGAIHHLRMSDPCWFQDDDPQKKLCVDDVFMDKEGYTCSDYGDATKEECKASSGTVKANDACCACGGGRPEESWTLTTVAEREL